MARRVVTQFIDDLDGKEIKDGRGGEVRFSVDSAHYVIDLSHGNKRKLLDALAPFIDKARGDKDVRPVARKTAQNGVTAGELRHWARRNGFEVQERGRIPRDVYEAYASRN